MAKSRKNSAIKDELFNEDVVQQRFKPNPLSEFVMSEEALRLALVTAQYALRETRSGEMPTGLLVLVNGMEQAGKGSAVKQLREWVDPRLLKVEATIGHMPLEHQPLWQAYTSDLPRHGDVMVHFGNWYADLLHKVMRMIADAHSKLDNQAPLDTSSISQWQKLLQEQLNKLAVFEQDLQANHTQVLKCWFHIDADTLKARLSDTEADPLYLYQIDWHNSQVLTQFNAVAASLLRQQGDWVVIDGNDKSQAATNFCHEVLQAMQKALSRGKINRSSELAVLSTDFEMASIPKSLATIKDHDLKKSDYKKQLADKQAKFAALIRARQGRHVVFAFEGMDAAGKGGAIKRMVAPLDPREYQIYNIAAPMLYELEHPYLWRFWTRLPDEQTDHISRLAIFDRTWYGRVLVERVEGFAEAHEWQRAYDEINRFEADLSVSGTQVIKFWLAIDEDEQLKRFEARGETAHKQFKLTDDDWRNREKWSEYVQAAADMLARTDTEHAPWCIVATNDKRYARLQVLEHAIEQLKKHD